MSVKNQKGVLIMSTADLKIEPQVHFLFNKV